MDATERLRRAIEATRLGFGTRSAEVQALIEAAMSLRVRAICISPCHLAEARALLERYGAERPELVTVANFPLGDRSLGVVRHEIAAALAAGAEHIDLVVPGALVRERRWSALTDFLRAISAEFGAGSGRALKVILESAALDEEELRGAAECAISAGAGWLKTSTGFHPAGGATPEAVGFLRALAPPGVGIKASGGIRTRSQALDLLAAGADRLGTSSERRILEG